MPTVINPFRFGAIVNFIADDGDAAPSSGVSTSVHTYNSKTSTGPQTILCLTAWDANAPADISPTSVVWGGTSLTKIRGTTTENVHASIWGYLGGALSGNIVVTFSAGSSNPDDSEITILSYSGIQSLTAVDSDIGTEETGSSISFDALNTFDADGCFVCCAMNEADTTAVTWTNATERSDLDAGSFRHTVANGTGTPSGTITCSGGSADWSFVGVSLR